MIGLAMLIGRFGYILPVLALPNWLGGEDHPLGSNSFPTHGPLFDLADIGHFVGRWFDLLAGTGAGSDCPATRRQDWLNKIRYEYADQGAELAPARCQTGQHQPGGALWQPALETNAVKLDPRQLDCARR